MKLTTFLLFVMFFQVSAGVFSLANGQIKLKAKNESVNSILKMIEDNSDYRFVFNSNNIDVERKTDINISEKSIEEVLDLLLEGTKVEYRSFNNTYVLFSDEGGSSTFSQQQNVVSGKVTDAFGGPLPGVTVVVKGTTNGTNTDTNGSYSLSNIPENATLQFSFVGMKTQEFIVGNKTTINVSLVEDAIGIEEVVAVGYGTQKRRDVLGSVSSIKSEDITSNKTTTLEGGLQGLASGLLITSSNGNPGAQSRVLIRGLSTISSNSSPLWVVDGTPTGDISNISPADIASIEVLKDAGATAIYGSRGANGVILITTKTADPNKRITSVNISTGISNMTKTASQIGIANTSEWFQLLDLARSNNGQSVLEPTASMAIYSDQYVTMNNNKGYNPITRAEAEAIDNNPDDFFRKGSFTDLNLSSSIGFDKGAMFLSFNYRNDKGVEKDEGLDRISLRMNFNYEPVKDLKLSSKIFLSRVNRSAGANQFANQMSIRQSWYPIYDETEPTGYWAPYSPYTSTYVRADKDYVDASSNQGRAFLANALEYAIPFIQGLTLNGSYNADISYNSDAAWRSLMIRDRGYAWASAHSSRSSNILWNAYINYDRTFAENHKLTFTAGMERQTDRYDYMALDGEDLNSSIHELGYMPAIKNDFYAGLSGERYLGSYFSRLSYQFKSRYLLEFNIRQDGSSVFFPNNTYGLFPSVAAGWILSEEEFFAPVSKVVNFAKIRGSYGQTGNQQIPAGVMELNWITGWGAAANWGGSENQGSSGSFPDNIANQDLTWETTSSYDAGIDFGLFENRVTGSFAYYMKDVDGLLLALNVPSSAGAESGAIWKNIGRVQTQGFEWDFHWTNINKNDFNWSSSFNFTTSKNVIKSLNPDIDTKGSGIAQAGAGTTGRQSTYLVAGEAIGAYYMADHAGVNSELGYLQIYELDQEIFLETGKTVRTGNILPATVNNLQNNRFIQGGKTANPTYWGALGNKFEYKGFDLNALFTFSGGNYLYNDFNASLTQGMKFWAPLSNKLLTESWTTPGDNAKYGQVKYNAQWNIDEKGEPSNTGVVIDESQDASTRYLEKADYIRLKTLQLGYSFSNQITSKLRVDNIRIYVSATNLLTFTKYSGWDPEFSRIDYTGGSLQNRKTNMLNGYTGTTMPNYKTISFGLSVGF